MSVIDTIPLYEQRTLVPPSTAASTQPTIPGIANDSISNTLTFHPRTVLPSSKDHHAANFQQLLFFRECFVKREFWDECAILERMHYKNKSQHRQAGYFLRICECRRIASRMKELDIAGLTDELVSKFYSGKSIKSLKSSKSQWDSVPYRSTVAYTMIRIVGAILLLRKLQRALHETYGSLYQLMSKTQFMSFALITIGLCSRLSVISKAWVNELQDCYFLLEEWMRLLPKEALAQGTVNYESQLPGSLSEALSRSSVTVPNTPLPSTPVMPIQDRSLVGVVNEDGLDLGQVILRRMDEEEEDESTATLETVSQKSSRRTSESASLEDVSANTQVKESSVPSIAISPSHSHLLAELDTVFGGSSSPRDTPSPGPGSIKKKKKLNPAQAIDDIFGSSSSVPRDSPSPGTVKKKKAARSSDMDSIFGTSSTREVSSSEASQKKMKKSTLSQEMDDIFGSGSPRTSPPSSSTSSVPKNTKSVSNADINDIFGSIAAPPKKKKATIGSEIDSIFGPPKKKKKPTASK